MLTPPPPPARPVGHQQLHQQQHQQQPPRFLVSPQSRHVQPAAPGEVAPLQLGRNLTLDVPLLAAPLAGITAAPLRLMYTDAGARLAVSEMIIASTLQAGCAASRHLARFHPREPVRSVQLYGVRPEALAWACAHLAQEAGVHHIDVNFGCPVRKVTAKGGGAALPLRPRLLRRLIAAAVAAAGDVPVTIKLRMGLSDELLTYLDAGRIAADEGAAAVTLHARTADQQYAPPARWGAIRQLVEALPASCPVIGNGDVYEAGDAISMMRATGCRGVMIGRAALGRPWLFSEAAGMLAGRQPRPGAAPDLAGVLDLAWQHLVAWADWEQDELSAVLKMRKLVPCYLAGFSSPRRQLLGALCAARTLDDYRTAIADPQRWQYDPAEPYSVAALRTPRLKGAGQGHRGARVSKVALPAGWLDAEGDGDDDVLLDDTVGACEG